MLIFHNIFYSFCIQLIPLKRRNSWPPDVSTLEALNDYTWQKYLYSGIQFVLSAFYIKQIL